MRVKSTPVSSLKQESPHFSGTRTRKKHKRLDAICEDTYKRNHAESSKGVSENGVVGDDAELRRSSRARRAPVILDASPPPPKKRKKIEKDVGESVEKSTKLVSPQVKESEVESLEDVETPGSWKSRLRVRRKYIRFGKMNDYDMKSPRRKRKLFVEMDREGNEEKQLQRAPNEEKVKVVRKTMEFEVGFSVKKLRRRGRGKRANLMGGEKKADGSNLVKENNILDNGIGGTRRVDGETIPEDSETGNQNEKPGASDDYDDEKAVIGGDDDDEKAVTSDDDEEEEDEEKAVTSDDDDDDDDDDEEEEEEEEKAVTSDDDVEVIEEEVKGLDGAVQINEESHRNDVVVPAEQTEDVSGRVEVVAEEIPEKSNEVVAEKPGNKLEERSHDGKDMNSSQLHEKPIENGNNTEKDALIHHSMESLPLSGIKGGRRCGLCGGCNDGKPPKKLVLDMVESDNEACNGSSASEEPIYDTLDGFGDEPGWLGRLLGPINDRYGIAGIWVHQHCAVWSPEVYFAGLGCLKNVRAALCRGRALKCSRCGRPGATIGCRVDRCPKTYHLPCARAVGCIFDHRKFLIACTDHRHIFQPHNNNLIHMKRLKIKKMKQTYRKISNEACRKDIETEEKWLENCGEDEEFLRREGKRLHRDLLRISPVYIGGTESESGQLFQGWESVAGLQDVIRCMKEVVILPLLYPNFFDNLGITPPRGILLHGYPGTGKTLVVRALIGSIARGDKRIAYFARKGADCLGKYVGDAERQLRLLFQVAEKCQPSIIFFDEIDGLAPVRTKQQDQTHSSVVSTLLALLDGLKSRGSVVVIGATNRPDAVDPALRRPGRFDREIYFPLPSLEDRAAILSLHTQKWPKPVSEPLLGWLTRKTAGFAGADLQALCTQAAMVALKRNFPLHEVLTAAGNSSHGGVDRTPLPSFSVEERDWLEALSRSPPPCSRREAGIAANDILSSPLPVHLVPCLLNPLSNLLVSLFLDERLCLPPALSRAAAGIANVIFSAMDRGKLARDQWRFHIDSLMQEANVSKEIERELSSAGILSGQLNGDAFTDNECTKSDCSLSYNFSTHAGSLRNFTFASRNKSGYRLLISGSPGSGQKHLASCILHCYIGNVEVQKVDLATVSQEGHGDMVQGISRILMKCANAGSSVLFMPRIDLWAMEKKHQDLNDESNYHSLDHNLLDERVACPVDSQVCKMDIHVGGTKESQDDFISASHIWNSFVEQVESICVNTSLVIVATSAVPFDALPRRITKCFSNDKLDGGRFAHLEGALPRFSVDIDVDVNCGLVIDQSAAKISRDLIQQFVQLIHQRAHNTICKESSLSTPYCTSITNDIAKHKLPNEQAPGTQRSDDNLVKTSAVSSKRNMKGKSSLMQAILTFGYQILQYPHFAELCWVTSKLKEGPIADVNGPWKSWPFNSCIVRPDSLAEKTSGSFNSSNVKSKEKSGLVRGLVAVGLSAYRGLYSSATEVSLQIRWVLELLVQQINERIQAGKDRYQFVRILSQVSYLEDMVSSWAYSLKSLEMDAQVTSTRVLATAAISPDSHAPHDPFSNGMHKQQAAARASTNIEVPEGICPGLTVGNTKSAELMENTAQCDQNGPLGTIVLPEEDSPDNATLLAGSEVHENPHHSVNANKLADKTSMVCDVRNMARELEGTVNSEAMFEKSGISGQSSGSALSNSSIPDKEGSSPAKPGTADCSNFHNLINQQSGLDSRNTGINGVLTSDRSSMHKSSFTNNAGNSDFVCSYLCCSKCLCSLHAVMRKLLIQEWGLNTSLSVEDVHDAVASLSVDLVSTLRRCYFSDNSSELLGGERCLSISSLNLLMCQCRKSINSLTVAEECTSHSDGGSTNTDGDDSPSSEFGINVEFIMRNGVLTTVDFEKDVTFHCKYKILCLHPLLELVRNRTSL